MKYFAGLGEYLTTVSLNWTLVGEVTEAAVPVPYLGARPSGCIPEAAKAHGETQ